MKFDLLLSVIGVLLAMLGVPQIFGLVWKDIFIKLFYGGISWKEIDNLTLDLAKIFKINKPDLIVGVGRGGIVSAGLLCSKLTNDDILAKEISTKKLKNKNIKIETINTVRKLDKSKKHKTVGRNIIFSYVYEVENVDFDLSKWTDKRILIIIGETITGHTLMSTKRKIESICASENINISIETATLILHNQKHAKNNYSEIDYIMKTYKKKIIMPWKKNKHSS